MNVPKVLVPKSFWVTQLSRSPAFEKRLELVFFSHVVLEMADLIMNGIFINDHITKNGT